MPHPDTRSADPSRYADALGVLPPAFVEALHSVAEHAVAGEIHHNNNQYVAIGRANIDWTGSHVADHIWHERPKRFLYLPPLMAGYAATRDERYAEAARDYVADWMRAHPAGSDWTIPSYDNGLNLAVRVAFFAALSSRECAGRRRDRRGRRRNGPC